jgi:fatty-acyl-CoA synthase
LSSALSTDDLPSFSDLRSVAAVESRGLDRFVPERTVYELLVRSAERDPQHRATWHFAGGEPGARETHLSYEELVGRVGAAANLFRGLGVGREDVVACLLPSLAEVHEIVWGAATAGIACGINHFLEPQLIAAMLERTGARVLVVPGSSESAEIWAKVARLRELVPKLGAIVRVGDGPEGFDYRREVARIGEGPFRGTPPRADDVAAYFHTGGTTGAPKFAPQTHRRQVIAARSAAYALGLQSTDVVMNGLPHFHIGGLFAGSLVPLAAGATVVQLGSGGFRDRTVVPNVWRIAAAVGATALIAVPTVISSLVEEGGAPVGPKRLRFVICGASGLAPGLRAAFESRTGIRVNEAYGLTEATFVVSVNPWAGVCKPGSVGLRLPFVDVATLPTEPGAAMEMLAVRGPTVFSGYLGVAPESQPFRDGWLITGDLGRIDEDGHIHLSGRSKDLIKRGGHAIDPLLIEEPLAAHPAVALCAAVGQPDPRLGEIPVAYVARRAGTGVTEAELLDFAASQVRERAAVPKAIRIREALPKTSVGKIDKAALRRDATRLALLQALEAVRPSAGDPAIDVSFRGDTAVVRIAPESGVTPGIVAERLRDFTVPYEIEG